jgi:excisionase family DNA binding protein
MPTNIPADVIHARPELLSTVEAAAYLGLTPHALEVWRCTGRHQIPFIKVGRLVRYRQNDLDRWLESRLVNGNAV